jgi:alkaline phosphatase
MKNSTLLSSFRSHLQVPGILTAGVLALSQAFVAPALFAGSTTNEDKASQIFANKAKLNAIKTQSYQLPPTRAKNVILFIGDGMGISTITAARMLEGQNKGLKGSLDNGATTYNAGEQNLLSFEEFPYSALSRTYSINQQVSDSAPTMTAMVTGVKNNDGALSVTPDVVRGNDYIDSQKLTTIVEQVKAKGMSAGVVSSARVTHATPAACYAHASERNWENDSLFTTGNNVTAGRVPTTKDIAAQLLDCNAGKSLDVVLGGGRSQFMKSTQADPEYTYLKGSRLGRDLISEWKKLPNRAWNLSTGTASTTAYSDNPRSAYVWNKSMFDGVKNSLSSYDRVLGLFEPSHVQYEADRANDPSGEPSLAEMSTLAVDVLAKNRNGYFLMVEGGRIDHAHHAGNAYRALTDTIAFSDAIRAVAAKVGPDTLIVVSADHSHVFTIAGYPVRGNPILGLVKEPGVVRGATTTALNTGTISTSLDSFDLPYSTLGYANGPGYTGGKTVKVYSVTGGTQAVVGGTVVVTGTAIASTATVNSPQGAKFGAVTIPLVPSDSGGFYTGYSAISGITTSGSLAARPTLTLDMTSNVNYLQESTVPLGSETHAGEDVAIFAKGPNAHLFRGTLEQSMIYWVMADALRLNN